MDQLDDQTGPSFLSPGPLSVTVEASVAMSFEVTVVMLGAATTFVRSPGRTFAWVLGWMRSIIDTVGAAGFADTGQQCDASPGLNALGG